MGRLPKHQTARRIVIPWRRPQIAVLLTVILAAASVAIWRGAGGGEADQPAYAAAANLSAGQAVMGQGANAVANELRVDEDEVRSKSRPGWWWHPRHTPTTTVPTTWSSSSPSTSTSTSVSATPTRPSTSATSSSTAQTSATSTSVPLCPPTKVWSALAACGWPGPGNTGYPTGQAFGRSVNGALDVTVDNTVIDGWRVTGGIQVHAKNVTIRNSWVTSSFRGASGSGVINLSPGASATIERSLLDGLNATHACIWDEGTSMIARANNCTGVNDGIFMWATVEGQDGAGDHFTIADNWIHGLTTQAANGHMDGIQTEGAKHGIINHNTIDNAADQTSAIAIWNSRKSSDDIAVVGNLMAGGGFTAYAEDYSPSESNPAGGYSVTNVSFTINRFSAVHYGCVGYWGVWFVRGAPTDGWKRSGNVVHETGQNLDNQNPTVNGRVCS